jgi:uncharacterized protein YndB with AHSA1/START domain
VDASVSGRAPDPARAIVITREFAAPRELVFAAWLDPRHVRQWWGPRGYGVGDCVLDPRPGGKYRIVSINPGGTEYPVGGTFRELVAPQRIVMVDDYTCSTDPPGRELKADGAAEEWTEVTFDALPGGGTRVTLRTMFATAEECQRIRSFGAERGMAESLDKLAEYLPAIQGASNG